MKRDYFLVGVMVVMHVFLAVRLATLFSEPQPIEIFMAGVWLGMTGVFDVFVYVDHTPH